MEQETNQSSFSMSSFNSKKSIDDFLTVVVLGRGSYAKVVLVKEKDTKQIFAMKILKKKHIEKRKQEEHVITERNVLVKVKHPFIVNLHCSFQNEQNLYFVLEYCPGGELFNLLQKRKHFTEDQTRFYAAQIVLALECLHNHDIIYRDLKPENVLIDAEGYIRIADFGLSKDKVKNPKDAKSVCGTPEYLAPEVLFKMGHGKPVDFWALGAIIYEMLTGLPPFFTDKREELFERIKFKQLQYPPNLTNACKKLLDGLFQKSPEKRLGYKRGAEEIKEHPWFLNVSWEILARKEYKPPYVPIISSSIDVSNFDREFTEGQINSYSQGQTPINNKTYIDFTYTGNNMDAIDSKMDQEE